MLRSKLTERWQTTIPAEVRRALRLKPRQSLVYEIRGESVVLRCENESLMDVAGILKTDVKPMTKQQSREKARKAVAERVR